MARWALRLPAEPLEAADLARLAGDVADPVDSIVRRKRFSAEDAAADGFSPGSSSDVTTGCSLIDSMACKECASARAGGKGA